eukprot:200255_1
MHIFDLRILSNCTFACAPFYFDDTLVFNTIHIQHHPLPNNRNNQYIHVVYHSNLYTSIHCHAFSIKSIHHHIPSKHNTFLQYWSNANTFRIHIHVSHLSHTTSELGHASICQSNTSLLRIIGTLWSSVVIGLYCLCGFIYPLRKYLKTGRTYGANDALVRYLLLKIIIYTIIMISTTIISASIFVISNDSIPTELVTAINYVINSYCMILQFKDLDIKHIQSQSIQSIVSCLQCSCCCIQQIQIKVQKEVDLADIMTIKRESPDTSGSGSQETSRACSETTPSDFHEDRRKYIETIIQGDIDNGVTGKYLSLSVVETAYIFWKKYIETAPKETQTELACCIYFEMMGMNDGMAELLKERVEKKQC